MQNVLFAIGEKIIKVIAANLLGEESLVDSNDIASLCSSFFKSKNLNSQLRLQTALQSAQLELINHLEEILSHSSLSDIQRNAVEDCILATIDRTDLSSSNLVKLRNSPVLLTQELISNCRELSHFQKDEEAYAKKCLSLVSSHLISIVSMYAEDFHAKNYSEILKEIDRIKDLLSQNYVAIMENIKPSINANDDFYSEYMSTIRFNHRNVELFSSKIGDCAQKYDLNEAYVELFLKLNNSIQEKPMAIHSLLNHGKRWLITGEAGCGKTTLLKWLAYTIAQKTTNKNGISALTDYFPVFITLRKIENFDKISLKLAIQQELSGANIHIPNDLLNSLNHSGKKLLLLIDGLDEIDEQKRSALYNWLYSLIASRENAVEKENGNAHRHLSHKERAKNEIIILLTSRPILSSIALSNLKQNINLDCASIQPMDYVDVHNFIDYWHNAISVNRYFDEAVLLEKASQLKERISSQEALSRLAQNPLLCAMICALHFKKNGLLPTNKLELYDECSQMLLEERDSLRKIDSQKYSAILQLEYEDKRRILSDLALWMLESDGALIIDYSIAATRLKQKISFLQRLNNVTSEIAETQSKLILTYFLERSGILHWIDDNKIGFIHKTFQEYFAAYQIYLGEEWIKISSHRIAMDTTWRETILLAVAFSNKANAEKVINTFLCRSGDRVSTDIPVESTKANIIIYKLLAINCAAVARELDSNTKKEIDLCTQSLIPPSSQDIVKSLSTCGNLVVPLLKYNPTMRKEHILSCAKVLLHIGSRHSLAQMVAYLDSKDSKIYETFTQYWSSFSTVSLRDSGIIPAYIESIFVHSIKNIGGSVSLDSRLINQLSKVATYCSYNFSNSNRKYVLSEAMKKRLHIRMSKIRILKIGNHMFTQPHANEAILKILDLFSISKTIEYVSVAYEYTKDEIDKFVAIINQYEKLEHLVVNDVPPEIADELHTKLSRIGISQIQLREKRSP